MTMGFHSLLCAQNNTIEGLLNRYTWSTTFSLYCESDGQKKTRKESLEVPQSVNMSWQLKIALDLFGRKQIKT